MVYEYLKQLREYEIGRLGSYLRDGNGLRLLEIGAGAGWQAKIFFDRGFDVEAIDIQGSDYETVRVWEVKLYDGIRLPYPNSSFDVIFTSHVLERITEESSFQREIARVIKPDGLVVHIVPSATFALWNVVCHYPFALKMLLLVLRKKTSDQRLQKLVQRARNNSFLKNTLKAFVPYTLSVKGNFLSQIYFFSRLFWVPFFESNGWTVEKRIPTKFFCTGNALLGASISFRFRAIISYVLGSSSMIYILKKARS